MQIINGHRLYEEGDIVQMLYRVASLNDWQRTQICNYIVGLGYGEFDTVVLLNMFADPMEYNIDYMYSLDSDIGEIFIRVMEAFGLA